MKRIYFSSVLILLLSSLSTASFSQTKRFALKLLQPSSELCAVSIKSDKIENQLTIFPNPTQGEITISFGELMGGTKFLIQVFSLEGKILLSHIEFPEKSGFQKKLNLSSLTKGIYLVRISGDAFLANEKVILF